jgi:hypothetical protein
MTKPSSRPQLPKVSEQMKAWSSALEAEVADWPHASTRSFFGFTAVYRKDKIFAALPRTRAWGTANSLAFKLPTDNAAVQSRIEEDPRVGYTLMGKTRWFTFELSSDADLHAALDWIGAAYAAAGKKTDERVAKRNAEKKSR